MILTHPGSPSILNVDPDHAGPYLNQGWRLVEQPKGNASTSAWREFAHACGFAGVERMTRAELRALVS